MSEEQPKNNDSRKPPVPVQMALEVLRLLADEDKPAADRMSKLLPAFAMKLAKDGEEVTTEILLAHARQGIEHLTVSRTVAPEQKPLTYAEVAASLKANVKETDDENEQICKPANLLEAARSGEMKAVRQFTKNGADVNVKSYNGYTALILAASNGHIETIHELIANDADINAQNINGDTALMMAACNGHHETVRELIAKGADVNVKSYNGCTALMLAAQRCYTETVRELIVNHADVNAKDIYGRTALIMAAYNGYAETMHELIKNGVPLDQLKTYNHEFYKGFLTFSERWKKIAHCEPPLGLWKENPLMFKGKAFDAVKAMLAAEGYGDNTGRKTAFATAALFGTEQRVLQYLQKWGKPGKQPLHDIVHFIKLPEQSATGTPPDTKSWGDAVLKCGPSMAKMFSFADKLPQPEKSSDGKTWSYQNTREKASSFAYPRGSEHPELAGICFEHLMQEDDFNTALDLVQKQKKDIVKNIPQITIDGNKFDMDGASFHPLSANDVRGLVLGELTDCCQSIGGAGAECAKYGFMSENSGFYVVEKDHEILGQTWAWRGEKGEMVFDSLETLGDRVTPKQWKKLTEEFAKSLDDKPGNVTALHIGKGGATPKALISAFNSSSNPARPINYNGYRDSSSQVTVWKKEKRSP